MTEFFNRIGRFRPVVSRADQDACELIMNELFGWSALSVCAHGIDDATKFLAEVKTAGLQKKTLSGRPGPEKVIHRAASLLRV